jgi:hypothetical protein
MNSNKLMAMLLDDLMTKVENLSQESILPQSMDRQYWDDFICEVYDDRRD